MLAHSSIYVYYQKLFAMVQHHKYSITDLENLMPFERDLYFEMLIEFIKKQEEKQKAR
jgi:hypothetical protein